jgi:hypothetical protein
MAHKRLANINAEVNASLNESVEGLWQEEEVNTTHITSGLFSGIQSIGLCSNGVQYDTQIKCQSTE